MDILWKAGAVARARFTAQKTRALDTAPVFQQILLTRKRREGVAIGKPVSLGLATLRFLHSGKSLRQPRMADLPRVGLICSCQTKTHPARRSAIQLQLKTILIVCNASSV